MLTNLRIWSKNVMVRGENHTKGTPDVDERRTSPCLNQDFRQNFTPRLELETYKASTKHRDRL